jgi:hypothetical protein
VERVAVLKGTAFKYSVCLLSFNSADTLHPIFNNLSSILLSLQTDSLSTDESKVRTVRKDKECIVKHKSLHKLIKVQSRRNVEVTVFLLVRPHTSTDELNEFRPN